MRKNPWDGGPFHNQLDIQLISPRYLLGTFPFKDLKQLYGRYHQLSLWKNLTTERAEHQKNIQVQILDLKSGSAIVKGKIFAKRYGASERFFGPSTCWWK